MQHCNKLIAALMLVASTALAEWHHMDLQSGDWYTNTVGRDYYEQLRERYDMAGVTWAALTETYYLSDGSAVTLTNADIFSESVIVTEGTNVHTVVPHLTRTVLRTLDERLAAITTFYVQDWVSGSVQAVPAAVMVRAGVGLVSNLVYNADGVITGGEAYWLLIPSNATSAAVYGLQDGSTWTYAPYAECFLERYRYLDVLQVPE